MSKINETMRLMKSGSRANKFRIVYPVFGREIDIVCTAAAMPGRDLGTTDVFVKGRKIQLASEMADDGSWEMTIMNVDNHLHRRFFLKMLSGIHNFNSPSYLIDGGDIPNSDLSMDNIGITTGKGPRSGSGGGFSDFIGGISNAVKDINNAYNDVKNAFNKAKSFGNNVKNIIGGSDQAWDALESIISSQGYGAPWYFTEITIQQLDHNDSPIATAILHNAFVTSVGPVEYGDDSADTITTSSITFAYSGISFGDYGELPSIEKY